MRKFLTSTFAAALLAVAIPAAAEEGPALERQNWSWHGPFGQYDKAQLRRGFQVFREICSNCHSMKLVAYRNLGDLGFTEDEIKAIAAEKQVQDGPNDQGDMYARPARPSDRFVPPFPNDQAARVASNGALPPDLSLMTKARVGGPDYVYGILTGFKDTPPEGVTIPDGMYYNTAFPGHQIAMPPPVNDDQVTYADGTKATKEQISKDAVAFLNWAAEPELDQRHSLGVKTLIFVFVMTILFYALKRKIWARLH
ncbi:cytochrome c1 [Telmatospirillum siberiense]|uniref:Cytochrome c1 n=1 Tax=Telmatospirillum siberiense TaxID=382514 RepID=A0A2N3PU52_9PROT|nr:cytochrome c1 [Telmatospirillum siberiense]PKU23920.1 cytochrome c1 [Telmatospirillum siberiense]